jgi:hypothetical protein
MAKMAMPDPKAQQDEVAACAKLKDVVANANQVFQNAF